MCHPFLVSERAVCLPSLWSSIASVEPHPEEMPCSIFPSAMELKSSTRVVSTKESEARRVSSPKAKHRVAREGWFLSVEESEAVGSMESDVVRGHLEK